MTNTIIHLYLWRDAEHLIDIVEVVPSSPAGTIAWALEREGYDLPPEAFGNEAFAELRLSTTAGGADNHKWRIVPGALPDRCRKPRACVSHEGRLISARDFARGLLDGSINP